MSENIIIDNITYNYGKFCALKDVSAKLPTGKFISLIGPNGSGKTTLFNIICGDKKCAKGSVLFCGKDIHSQTIRKRAKDFAVIHQREHIKFPFTCAQIVSLGLNPHISMFEPIGKEHMDIIDEVMEKTDTLQFADKYITGLSGGERQRVNIARALAQRTKVLFLDEAMSDMDISAKIKMTKMLKDLTIEQGITVIAINHDVNMAYKFSDLVIALKKGKLSGFGHPKDVMTQKFFGDIFEVKTTQVGDRGFIIEDRV